MSHPSVLPASALSAVHDSCCVILVISVGQCICCSLLPLYDIDLPCLQVVALGQFYHNALNWSQNVALGLLDDVVLIWLQVVALGLVAHPGAYLRSPWNQLDAVVVITSIISTASPNNHVGILKALRLLRVLRPLRMISRFKVTYVSSCFATHSVGMSHTGHAYCATEESSCS